MHSEAARLGTKRPRFPLASLEASNERAFYEEEKCREFDLLVKNREKHIVCLFCMLRRSNQVRVHM